MRWLFSVLQRQIDKKFNRYNYINDKICQISKYATDAQKDIDRIQGNILENKVDLQLYHNLGDRLRMEDKLRLMSDLYGWINFYTEKLHKYEDEISGYKNILNELSEPPRFIQIIHRLTK